MGFPSCLGLVGQKIGHSDIAIIGGVGFGVMAGTQPMAGAFNQVIAVFEEGCNL